MPEKERCENTMLLLVLQGIFLGVSEWFFFTQKIPRASALPGDSELIYYFAISTVIFYVVNILLLRTPQSPSPLKGMYRQSLDYGCTLCSMCASSNRGSTLSTRRMKHLFFLLGCSYMWWTTLLFMDIQAAFIVSLLNVMLMIVVWYHLSKVFYDTTKPHVLFILTFIIVIVDAIYTTHLLGIEKV